MSGSGVKVMGLLKRKRLLIIMIRMAEGSQKTTTTSYAIITIVAALAVLGIAVPTVVIIPQQAEAGCITGFIHGNASGIIITATEKSEGRCISHP